MPKIVHVFGLFIHWFMIIVEKSYTATVYQIYLSLFDVLFERLCML